MSAVCRSVLLALFTQKPRFCVSAMEFIIFMCVALKMTLTGFTKHHLCNIRSVPLCHFDRAFPFFCHFDRAKRAEKSRSSVIPRRFDLIPLPVISTGGTFMRRSGEISKHLLIQRRCNPFGSTADRGGQKSAQKHLQKPAFLLQLGYV